jgi:hypothetical protein
MMLQTNDIFSVYETFIASSNTYLIFDSFSRWASLFMLNMSAYKSTAPSIKRLEELDVINS